ncbi:hypothetical protein GOP47_0021603 [Adiantum capillus-veneris]|uniref:Mitochondrial import inner membrane translocase subunit n=1 Tax=Adiantum capillus-veneris TaxID=13818 RepID=A0A9D4Z811_ADICA|nr:hypothetical protein GOP47_0021603 [Adiantum capillus-veneris]
MDQERRPQPPASLRAAVAALAECKLKSSSEGMDARKGMEPGDLDNLSEADKLRMVTMIDQLQVRDSLRMYNSLVEKCFGQCIDNFRRKTLDKQEESCVRVCAEKYLKHSMRVSLRFTELNQGSMTPD